MSEEDFWLMRASTCVALFCTLLMVYNATLTVDPGGYMVMLFLSFPFILVNCSRKETMSVGKTKAIGGCTNI